MQNGPSLLDAYPGGLLDIYPGGTVDVLFSIEIDVESDAVAVAVHGELDISTGRRLLSALEPLTWNGRPWVRLDLGHVSFIDSSGAMAIIELSDRVARKNGALDVGVCSERVEQIFALIGIPLSGYCRTDP